MRCFGQSTPGGRGGVNWLRAIPLFLFFLPLAAFAPCLFNGFVNWDDNILFWENPCLGKMGSAQLGWAIDSVLGKPAAWPGGEAGESTSFQPLSWWLTDGQVTVFGLSPFAIHLVSLLFHAANAVLLYWVTLAIVRRARPAWEMQHPSVLAVSAGLAVALYAIHPLRVEVVAWAAAQPYLPCSFLVLLSVLGYVHAFGDTSANRKMLAMSSACFVLALLAKPLVVGLPLIFLLLDWYPLRRLQNDAGRLQPRALAVALLEKLPLLALSALSMTLSLHLRHALVPLEQDGIMGRLTQVGHSVWFYLEKTIAPFDLCFLYAAPTETPWLEAGYVGTTLVVLLTTIVLLLQARRRPGWLVGWLSFLILLGPLIGLFRTSEFVVADRYSYVPLQAIVILLAAGFYGLGQRLLSVPRRILRVGVLAGALLLSLCGVSWQQSGTWHDTFTLFNQGARHGAAASPRTNGVLGSELLASNRLEESAVHFGRAVELDPNFAQAHKLLGVVRIRQKNYAEAVPHLRRYLPLKPDDAEAYYLLGFALAHLGRLEDARLSGRRRPPQAGGWGDAPHARPGAVATSPLTRGRNRAAPGPAPSSERHAHDGSPRGPPHSGRRAARGRGMAPKNRARR